MGFKWFLLFLVVVAVVLASPVSAAARSELTDDYYYQYRFIAETADGVNAYPSQVTAALYPTATDGWDGELAMETRDGPTVDMAIYRPDWPGETGFFTEDFRFPPEPGQTKTWTLYLWATPDVPDTDDTIEVIIQTYMPVPPDRYNLQFDLVLRAKPDAVTGGPLVGTVWNVDYIGAWEGFTVPIYRTNDGLSGYRFELTATSVPEPSAFAVLVCGWVGIVIRTRKRQAFQVRLIHTMGTDTI